MKKKEYGITCLKMKFSILTPSYNQGIYIEENILSVLAQNYPDFEHIIIDGGSTDTTLEIVKKYPHLIWISEKDNGQSDALKKGLKIATGDILGWINSDDYYLPDTFNDVSFRFNKKNVDWLVGNIINKYDTTGSFVAVTTQPINFKTLSSNPDIVKQPAAFYKREFVIKMGGFNPNFYMVMDFDLWLRLSKVAAPLMTNKNYAVFRHHKHQKTSFKNNFKQLQEIKVISKREGIKKVYRLKLAKTIKAVLKYSIKKVLVSFHIIDKKYLNQPTKS
jgi:glycosyltransferase involved in cell wall biosynthesis